MIEYSGYNVAGPTDPIPADPRPGDAALRARRAATRTSSRTPPPTWARWWPVSSGFATVSLQMRGTGCSGGAFDLFGYPSDYDAYDAIEIVAHQAWVANHKVGMVGISYSGLSQLPVGGHRPARSGRHRPDEPDRRSLLDRVPRRHLQQRVRRQLDQLPASTTPSRPPRTRDGKAGAELVDPGLRMSASPGPTTRSTRSWRPAAERSSTCLANQALHEQSENLASLVGPAAGRPGHRAGTRPVALRSPFHGGVGRATSPCRSSSPARSRTSRRVRSGRR